MEHKSIIQDESLEEVIKTVKDLIVRIEEKIRGSLHRKYINTRKTTEF